MKIIKQTCIYKILEASNVEVIVGHYLELKKKGTSLTALSPFVTENTVSFMVSVTKNIWKDFASGNGGSPITFIMEYKKLSYIEAVKEAAKICKIPLEYEELTPDEEQKQEDVSLKKKLLTSIAKQYEDELSFTAPEHWSKKMVTERKWNEESILGFHLGYAPATKNFIAKKVIEAGQLALAKDIGIVKTNETSQTAYDFLIDRLIFPIQNLYGEIIAFGGRASKEADKKYAKYLNSTNSIIYNKDKTLYGLYQAKTEIRKQNRAILVEGYADVISVHQSLPIAVATCGTSLSLEHAKVLRRLCNHVIIWRDGDTAGDRASMKDLDILLKNGFKVSLILSPKDKDPDDVVRETSNLSQWVEEHLQDAILWKALKLRIQAENPDEVSAAVQEICGTLSCIDDEIKREEYIREVNGIIKQKIGTYKRIITEKITNQTSITPNSKKEVDNFYNLPEGADKEQYIRDRFCEVDDSYYFQGKEGLFFKGTNFRMNALFHIYGKVDNKRLCEVVNELGKKVLIDFESKDFINYSKMQETLVNEGFFVFDGGVTNSHFKLVTKKVLNDFIMAYELKTLGWQNEGFFAFADGVYYQNQFQKVNRYGIVQLENLPEEDEEYQGDIKHYYSPAFSEIYRKSREDDDPYENDRNFVYKVAPVSLDQWMQQMRIVYGDKGVLAVGFIFASIFRDFYIKRYSFFPHLGLFGEKGSGKSKFGDSIQAFFFSENIEPFDLNSGTVVGFVRRMARVKNVVTFLEEYNDKIHEVMFQSMKGAYDGRGREKGKDSSDNRTTTTRVNSAIIYAGQYYPVRDDNSLASRSILVSFIKETRTNEEVEEYNKLKSWEEQGLSSLIIPILQYRDIIEGNFHRVYGELIKKLKNDLDGVEVQERMINNYLALFVPVYILWDKFTFPFTQEYFYNICKEMIINTSDLITESEGLADFWNVFEYLCEVKILHENVDYKIDIPPVVKMAVKREGKTVSEEWLNSKREKVIYIYIKKVYQDIYREMSRRGQDMINETTLKNYFRAKKYFIGGSATTRLGDKSPSCSVFNYSQMSGQSILNIERDARSIEEASPSLFNKDPETLNI